MPTTAKRRNLSARLAKLKALVTDVDGVLTDGTIGLTGTNEPLRKYYVRDGIGIIMLQRTGILCALLSADNSVGLQQRAKFLGINAAALGIKNKEDGFAKLLSDWKLTPDQVGYIGDDLIDMAPLLAAGVSFAPADAHPTVCSRADIVTQVAGGHGAVREVCELILRAQDSKILASAEECGLLL